MPDYNKLNIRFSNFGVNFAHDPSTVPFGRYILLTNLVSDLEGRLTARPGINQLDASAAPDEINTFRRLNDPIRDKSTYIVKCANGVIYSTMVASVASTADGFSFTSEATGFADEKGSIVLDRTAKSNQVWAYVADSTKMQKFGINGSSTVDTQDVGLDRPPDSSGTWAGVAVAGGSLTADTTYNYRFAYYDSATGVESLYQDEGDVSITTTGANKTGRVTIPANGGLPSNVDKVRVYRKGGLLAQWKLAKESAYTGSQINVDDTATDTSLANATTIDEVGDRPFITADSNGDDQAGTPLPYLFGPYFGYVLGCGDPNNPGYVYWTNKFNPDRQDPDNRVEVTSPADPLLGGFIYDGRPYVWSKEALHVLNVGLSSATFTPARTSCGRGLFAPNAYCVADRIYFMAKDGLYATSGGTEVLLSGDDIRPLFEAETSSLYEKIDFTELDFHHMAYHENEIWLHYKGATTGATFCVIFDLRYQRWRVANFRVGLKAIYSDEQTTSRLLFGGRDGHIYEHEGTTDDNGSPATIPVQLTTGVMTLGAPLIHKEWGFLIFDIDPSGETVTFKVYTDRGTTLTDTFTTSAASRTRVVFDLDELYAEDLAVDITWATSSTSPILYSMEVLYRPDVVQLERWKAVGVNHGIVGWHIPRSAYITYRSDGTLDFELTADGTVIGTYTLPDTSGAKERHFISFDPIKGKIFDYEIAVNAATYFRLYNNDCEVHVKPWVTSSGWAQINPFQGGGETLGNQDVGGQSNRPGLALPGPNSAGQTLSAGDILAGLESFEFLGSGGSLPQTAQPGSGTQTTESTIPFTRPPRYVWPGDVEPGDARDYEAEGFTPEDFGFGPNVEA